MVGMRRAAWWLIGALLLLDAAASGWLWLLWTERHAQRTVEAGKPRLSRPLPADPPAAQLKQRVR
jgi:hypothetical protein